MMIEAFGLSDTGLVRLNNEDYWQLLPSHHFYALADGLGGRNSGEIASKEALTGICESIRTDPIFQIENPDPQVLSKHLRDIIQQTNSKIWSMSQQNPSLSGMATTLTCILFHDNACLIANVGDSRIYRMRKHRLELLTHDDSLVFDLLHMGLINEDEAHTFPLKHVITKSIGSVSGITPTLTESTAQQDDLFLLCSDGLYNLVNDRKIEEILRECTSLEKTTHALVNKALVLGGLDNITVILLKIKK